VLWFATGLPVATFVVVVSLPVVALKAIVIESLGTPPVVALLVIVIVIAASLRLRLVHARESEGCFAYRIPQRLLWCLEEGSDRWPTEKQSQGAGHWGMWRMESLA